VTGFPTSIKDAQGTPIAQVYIPGLGFYALQGAAQGTDASGGALNGNPYAALSVVLQNATPLGQANMANSSPVVISSDQAPFQLGLFSADGPPDSTGKQQTSVPDKIASLQGKAVGGASTNITSTLAGDTNLVFSVAPKTIVPGQKIQLSVGAGNAVETVIVSSSYVPSSTATSIPLQYPVVTAGSTTAKWDVHAPLGPAGGLFLPTDIGVVSTALTDPGGSGQASIASYASGDNQSVPKFMGIVPYLLNGAGFSDKQRGNLDVQLLASAARTTTQTSTDIINYNGRGIKVWLIVTVAGTGSITLAINAKDPGSVAFYPLLTGAAVTTISNNPYTLYPGLTAVANQTVNDILPRTFQIVVTANNANSMTYSVGYSIIL
jgi:hypothetical protein